ncbi:hypothetical protein N7470_003739 [Penicillium chermesinum]|nr:hypothetical protein N7470_003739 [Penicillium chermesinum]
MGPLCGSPSSEPTQGPLPARRATEPTRRRGAGGLEQSLFGPGGAAAESQSDVVDRMDIDQEIDDSILVRGYHSRCRNAQTSQPYCLHILEFDLVGYTPYMTDVEVLRKARDIILKVLSISSDSSTINDNRPLGNICFRVTLKSSDIDSRNAYFVVNNRLLKIHDMLDLEFPWFRGLPWISSNFKVERVDQGRRSST